MNRTLLMKILLIRKLRKRLKRKKRQFSIRPLFLNRLECGETKIIKELREDPEYHHKYFRMSKESYDEIFAAVHEQLTKNQTHSRPISAMEKLAITIRYLATGNSQTSLSFSARISTSSICLLLRETMHEICETLGPIYLPAPSPELWIESEQKFSSKWQFPNCVGALDGKHIETFAPSHSGSTNFNYKGYFSQVLLAIVGADYKFLVVDIGASGSQSDGGIFMRSSMGKALANETLHLPPPKAVGVSQPVILPHVIVADDAFPLKNNLMKPYPGKLLPINKRVFNRRLSRARMVVECAFGIFAARWRMFHTPINAKPDFVSLMIQTSVILHNFLMTKKDFSTLPSNLMREIEEGKNTDTLESVSHQGSNNFTQNSNHIRNLFCDYFNGEGALQWIHDEINEQ